MANTKCTANRNLLLNIRYEHRGYYNLRSETTLHYITLQGPIQGTSGSTHSPTPGQCCHSVQSLISYCHKKSRQQRLYYCLPGNNAMTTLVDKYFLRTQCNEMMVD